MNQSLVSLEGMIVGEGQLEGIDEGTLVRCSVGGVFYDGETQQWRVRELQVKGVASYAKTLPDTSCLI